MLSLFEVASNLYYLAETSSKNDLVPSLTGNQIYGNCYHALINRKIYDVTSLLISINLKEMVEKIIDQTKSALGAYIERLENYERQYKAYLESLKAGEIVIQEINEAKIFIGEWNQWFRPIFKKYVLPQQERIEIYINKAVLDQCILSDGLAKKIQKILDLESNTNFPMPISELTQLSEGIQNQSLSHWVKQCMERSTVRNLHRALLSVFDPSITADIEWKLAALCEKNMWQKKDEKHLEWRYSLKQIQKITFVNELGKPQTLDIDPPLGLDPQFEDGHITFPLKENPSQVVVICKNRALTCLEEIEYQNHSPNFLKRVQLVTVFSNGKFKIMERYGSGLSLYQWTSEDILSSEDEKLAKKISLLLVQMLEGNFFLSHLSPHYLLYDPKIGELKTYKVFLPKTKNGNVLSLEFNRLEKFVAQCAQNNLSVFRYLMESSFAWDHHTARFYRKVVEEACSPQPLELNDLCIQWGITDSVIIDTAQTLFSETKNILRKISTSVERTPRKIDPNRITCVFLQVYRITSASFFWPTIVEEAAKLL